MTEPSVICVATRQGCGRGIVGEDGWTAIAIVTVGYHAPEIVDSLVTRNLNAVPEKLIFTNLSVCTLISMHIN